MYNSFNEIMTHLVEVLPTPFGSILARVAIEYGEVPLPTHSSEIHHKGVCILHRPSLSFIIVYTNLISDVVREVLIQRLRRL